MKTIIEIRRKIKVDVFDYQALMDALSGYRKPRDKITRFLAGGEIIRIKKGLYCFSKIFRREPIHREYLANLIYGPSYVSLEYALSIYGLIPERVETVTSVTCRRSRNFDTAFGRFSYRMLEISRYSTGATLDSRGSVSFLVASPEKALADKVWTDKRFSGIRMADYAVYLTEDLRIDPNALDRLDLIRLQDVAAAFNSKKINNMVRYLKLIKESSGA